MKSSPGRVNGAGGLLVGEIIEEFNLESLALNNLSQCLKGFEESMPALFILYLIHH